MDTRWIMYKRKFTPSESICSYKEDSVCVKMETNHSLIASAISKYCSVDPTSS